MKNVLKTTLVVVLCVVAFNVAVHFIPPVDNFLSGTIGWFQDAIINYGKSLIGELI